MKLIFLIGFVVVSNCFASDKDDELKRREFYEYDTYGTRGDRIKHNIRRGIVKVATSPVNLVRHGYRKSKHLITRAKSTTHVFMTESGSVDGHHRKLHEVLTGWENSDDLKTIMKRQRHQERRILFGIPYDAWRLLKHSLIAAGFVPRFAWRELRHVVMGTKYMIMH